MSNRLANRVCSVMKMIVLWDCWSLEGVSVAMSACHWYTIKYKDG